MREQLADLLYLLVGLERGADLYPECLERGADLERLERVASLCPPAAHLVEVKLVGMRAGRHVERGGRVSGQPVLCVRLHQLF